jgi:hypothetical protein
MTQFLRFFTNDHFLHVETFQNFFYDYQTLENNSIGQLEFFV